MMTTATQNQPTVPGEPATRGETPFSFTRPADLGLLVTLNSRMHCRTPMQRVDPEELPLRQPVHVDGTSVIPSGMGSSAESVSTYRCACGFTIDAPAESMPAARAS